MQLFSSAVLAAALMCASAQAADFRGNASVVDGDTVYVAGEKLRLDGIDAPEIDQLCLDANGRMWSCGLAARDALQKLAVRQWSCKAASRDLYDRYLATCTVDDKDLGRELVSGGWALAFRRYSNRYVAEEERAKADARGLWRGAFIAPWDWRGRNPKTEVLGARSVPIQAQRVFLYPGSSAAPSDDCRIKASLADGKCTYFQPDSSRYPHVRISSRSQRWFCTSAEAEAAGCHKETP